jgi:hypothetical protein
MQTYRRVMDASQVNLMRRVSETSCQLRRAGSNAHTNSNSSLVERLVQTRSSLIRVNYTTSPLCSARRTKLNQDSCCSIPRFLCCCSAWEVFSERPHSTLYTMHGARDHSPVERGFSPPPGVGVRRASTSAPSGCRRRFGTSRRTAATTRSTRR